MRKREHFINKRLAIFNKLLSFWKIKSTFIYKHNYHKNRHYEEKVRIQLIFRLINCRLSTDFCFKCTNKCSWKY